MGSQSSHENGTPVITPRATAISTSKPWFPVGLSSRRRDFNAVSDGVVDTFIRIAFRWETLPCCEANCQSPAEADTELFCGN